MKMTQLTVRQEHFAVVVIGRNEGERLVRCLGSVAALRAPRELKLQCVVYVDSNSSDNSLEAAQAMGAHTLALKDGPWTAARARNAGWRAAVAECSAEAIELDWILFLDGDTRVDPEFVCAARLVAADDDTIASITGQRREANPRQSIYTRVLDLDWGSPPGEAAFFGGDTFLRLAALAATDGFDDRLIAGEEPELSRRMRALGWRHQSIAVPMTTHDLAIRRFSQYWARLRRAGYAYAEVSERFRYTSDPLWLSRSRRNIARAAFWSFSALLALVAALSPGLGFSWLRAVAALGLWALLLTAFALRSAWLNRRKSRSLATLLLYGFHSHLQQLPVLLGQIAYRMDKMSAKRRGLIEYKL